MKYIRTKQALNSHPNKRLLPSETVGCVVRRAANSVSRKPQIVIVSSHDREPSSKSCVAHYFQSKYWKKKWYQRGSILGSRGSLSWEVGYAEVGYEEFYCILICENSRKIPQICLTNTYFTFTLQGHCLEMSLPFISVVWPVCNKRWIDLKTFILL